MPKRELHARDGQIVVFRWAKERPTFRQAKGDNATGTTKRTPTKVRRAAYAQSTMARLEAASPAGCELCRPDHVRPKNDLARDEFSAFPLVFQQKSLSSRRNNLRSAGASFGWRWHEESRSWNKR